MTKNIAIYGAGGLGREVRSLIAALPEWKVIGFFDDGLQKGMKVGEDSVLGGKEELIQWSEKISVVIAIGDPLVKKKVCEYLATAQQLLYPALIHPRALVMDTTCVVGEGTILTAGCIITNNVVLGKHVLINLNATIGHDSVVGDFTSVMPGANLAGTVKIGEAVLIGSGANVLSEVEVGNGSIIGAGAVVNHSVGDYVTAVGVPARAIKHTT
jgi:sugar O-acyltransferase (sialic acid O-acetyltransferase NeuD family)